MQLLFWARYNTISGCCTPSEYRLYDKNTGEEILSLGTLIMYVDLKAKPFAVSFADSTKSLKLWNLEIFLSGEK